MMNLQEFYIQHLGIGAIWKLRQLRQLSQLDLSDELTLQTPFEPQSDKKEDKQSETGVANIETKSALPVNVDINVDAASSGVDQEPNKAFAKFEKQEFDILVIRSNKAVSHSEYEKEIELLFQNILFTFPVFQSDKPFEVAVKKTDLASEHILFDQLIHLLPLSDKRVFAFFEVEVLQRFLDYYSLQNQTNLNTNDPSLIQATSLQQVFLFNNILLIQFPSLEEIIGKPLLKKDAWEKICFLQKHLHKST